MKTAKISILLVGLLISCFTVAEARQLETKLHNDKSIPVLTSGANSFAYVEVNPDGVGGSLKLAKITQTFPVVKATDIIELENYRGDYMVYDLDTSPDNRYLVSHRIQAGGPPFTDILERPEDIMELDILFYDMNTGEYLGFVDNEAMFVLNESLHPSESLIEYRQLQIDAGVPPEIVAEYDYTLHLEYSFIDFHDLHWNTDGTVSVAFRGEVYLILENGEFGFANIGTENFTVNYTVDPSGVSIDSYGNIKTAAEWPEIFDLSVQTPLPGNMRFESQTILFPQRATLYPGLDLSLYRPKKAVKIRGSIPMDYWSF